MDQVCISGLPDIIYTGAAGLITIVSSSFIANFVSPTSVLGKIIHFLALNFTVNKPKV